MAEVKNITGKDFDSATLKHQGFAILECVSDNNGLLKTMESVLIKLKESICVPFKHLRINAKKHPFIIDQFHVLKEPSYLIFFDGEFIDRLDGITSFHEFADHLNGHIKNLQLEKQ